MTNIPQPSTLAKTVQLIFLLMLFAGVVYLCYIINCIDGCGPYHNTTSVADLDGDGDLDVVLFNRRHEENAYIIWAGTTLWTNLDGGGFTPEGLTLPELPPDTYSDTVTGDVDNDGSADLVLLAFNQLRFYLNHGGIPEWKTSLFRMRDSIHGGEEQGLSGTVVLGDLDGDGDLDGFVAGCCGIVLYPSGERTYRPSYSWVWINEKKDGGQLKGHSISLRETGDLAVRQAALGDLDGDGDLDVYAAIVASKLTGAEAPADRVLLNDGSGDFHDSGQRLAPTDQLRSAVGGLDHWLRGLFNIQKGNGPDQVGSTAAALGDLDGDGDLDVLAGNRGGVQIWINQGGEQGGQAGIFTPAGQRIPGGPTEGVFLADLDGDGDPDALVAGRTWAAVWWNDGQGEFRDSGQRLRYNERYGLAIGDFNGDGYPDVFSSAYDIGFHLWLNQGDGRLQEGN